MNYRHAFHAGNFADVLKHVVLTRILLHLRDKPAAFRVIDTHAGAGLYDLASEEAVRGGEWQAGIGTLMAASFDPQVRALIEPYLAEVRALNPGGMLTAYPGSPWLVHTLLRPQDRLIACELEAQAFAALAHNLKPDRRAKSIQIDGWTALKAYVPPKERRGLVLIDPPFEDPDEFSHLARSLEAAHHKWPTGIYLVWYPVKRRTAVDAFLRRLVRSGFGKTLRIELSVGAAPDERLSACGLLAINPPWTLEDELRRALPALATALAGAAGRLILGLLPREN